MKRLGQRHVPRLLADTLNLGDSAAFTIATSLATPLLEAARESSATAVAAPWQDALQPSIVAILCAGTALEAATNWYATEGDPAWLALVGPSGEPNEQLPPDDKWRGWIQHRTGSPPSKTLLARVRDLTGDRALIGHDRGLKGPGGARVYQWPPTKKRAGISRTRAYFDAVRAARHVTTAEEAIEVLRSIA